MTKKIIYKKGESQTSKKVDSKQSDQLVQREPRLENEVQAIEKVSRELIKNKQKTTTTDRKSTLVYGTNKREIKTKNGKVTVQLLGGTGLKHKDAIKLNRRKLDESLCFSLEEIKGMKIESPIVISDPTNSSNILPGAVFDGESLLNTGKFVYQKMKFRHPVTLRTPPSNIVKNTASKAIPSPGEDLTAKLGNATAALINSSNFISGSSPNKEAELKTVATTVQDYLNLKIASSAFFMGISGENNFSYSSSEKSYMYLFTFQQKCLDVIADQISNPTNVFTDPTGWNNNWFYIEQVEYGRRLHILVKSYKKLETYMGKQAGELNWGIVGGKFSVEEKESNLFKEITIEALALGGAPFTETDPKKIDAAIKKYFAVPYNKYNIVPLTFTITTLNGIPASLITEAFLDGKNCLKTNNVRVYIKEINAVVIDDGASDVSEQLYGGINIFLYNENKKVVALDGKTEIKKVKTFPQLPTTYIAYGTEDHPIRVKYNSLYNEQSSVLANKFVDLTVLNLDYQIEIRPGMKEEDDFTDDVLKNQSGNFKMSLRNMLLEGIFSKTFFFNDGKTEIELTVGISAV